MVEEQFKHSSVPVKFELVEMTTRDGFIHQGMVTFPAVQGKRAILWVHGLTGRFYGDVKLMNFLADACNKSGMAFAAFNNRGHDVIASLKKVDPNEPTGFAHVMIGAGLETFEESVFDIDAGISFLVSKGYSEVIVVGHSTGANKACYYAGNTKDPRVVGVVLAGPISDRLSERSDKARYEQNLKMVRSLIYSGKGEGLLTKLHWFPLSAKRAFSLLGPNTKEDVFNYGDTESILKEVQRISLPLFVVFSGNEEYADRPIEDIKKIFDTHRSIGPYKSIMIAGTNHGFEGKEDEFVESVVNWSRAL